MFSFIFDSSLQSSEIISGCAFFGHAFSNYDILSDLSLTDAFCFCGGLSGTAAKVFADGALRLEHGGHNDSRALIGRLGSLYVRIPELMTRGG